MTRDEFERSVEECLPRLQSYLSRKCGNSPRIHPDDVVQDTLLKAFEKLGQFRGEKGNSFYAWLFKIAENTFKAEIRRPIHRTDFISCSESLLQSAIALLPFYGNQSPVDQVIVQNEFQICVVGFQSLPKNHKAALILDAQGYRRHEAAKILGVPLGTVCSWTHRARKSLGVEAHAKLDLIKKGEPDRPAEEKRAAKQEVAL